jgi:hypothetical protein
MAAVPGRVNWSAIAARAFRDYVDQLNPRDPREGTKSDAEKAGRNWAARVAEVTELRRLEKACDSLGNWQSCESAPPLSAAERFFFVIEPESSGNRSAAVEFWQAMTGKCDLPNDVYVEGFALGAIDPG